MSIQGPGMMGGVYTPMTMASLPSLTIESARGLARAGRLDEAAKACRDILAKEPRSLETLILLGELALQTGRAQMAQECFQNALSLNPRAADAYLGLAELFRRLGKFQEAIAVGQRATLNLPNDGVAFNCLGTCYLVTQQLPEAIACFTRATTLSPAVGAFYFNLGSALSHLGRRTEAIDAFRSAAKLDPEVVKIELELAQLLLTQGEIQEAAECLRRVLLKQPDLMEARALLAEVLEQGGDFAGADAILAEVTSDDPATCVSLGFMLQGLGRFEQASASFQRALARNPKEGAAYYGLSRSKRFSNNDQESIRQMQQVVSEKKLPPESAEYLHYALGKAFDDLGDYKKAMQHFDEANLLAGNRLQARFDREAHGNTVDWRIQSFTSELFAQSNGNDSELPIFIVGMIRSGTTLVEQILSTHPDIGAGGELRFWYEREAEMCDAIVAGRFGEIDLPANARSYLDLLQGISPSAKRVTDKMPMNFQLIGLIHAALPNARIIHCHRHPVDNCLSIYNTRYGGSPPFAHRRKNIVFYYQQYEKLMAHWREILPADRFLDVEYEDLVTYPEATTRRMIEFSGLEWHDECLHHERNRRSVRTPSLWQVRQPVYGSSKERWRNYEPWLAEFKKLMP